MEKKDIVQAAPVKLKAAAEKAKDSAADALNQNGDAKFGLQDIIALAVKTPSVRVNRKSFLEREPAKDHPKEVIDKAVSANPRAVMSGRSCPYSTSRRARCS